MVDLGLFYCALVWGATFYLVKDALAELDPVVLVAYRFLLAAAMLAPWALRRPGLRAALKDGALLALLLAGLYVSQTIGLAYTSATNSGFITGLFILFVPVFLWGFFDQRPTAAQWAAVALAVAGLRLLTGGASGFNRGDAWTLLAAAAYAAHVLATDKSVKGSSDTVALAFHQFWMTGAAALALAAALGAPFSAGGPQAAGTVLFLAAFPTCSAFFVQMWAQKTAPPLRVALIFSLEPVFAAVFAWTLGGETFRWTAAWGGALIVAAMVASESSKLWLPRGRKREVLPV